MLSQYEYTEKPCMDFEAKAGIGFGCTEAPRGILWHRYETDDNGCVLKANIVPPTSQNQPRIEQDLKDSLIHFGLDNSKAELQLHAEKVIRNYDPCISCATHFLNLNLIRDGFDEKTQTESEPVTMFTSIDLTKVAIIGIGSPYENDELGWRAIDELQKNKNIQVLKEKGLTLFKLDRPGITIADSLKSYEHVLIIDSIKPNQPDQPIHRAQSFICIDALQLDSTSSQLSSHELGVVESLTLLSTLDKMPKQLLIFGVSEIKDELIKKILTIVLPDND